MQRLLFFLTCGLACAGPLRAQLPIVLQADPSLPGWHESLVTHEGTSRWFLKYVPANLPTPAPVVILLHGGTGGMRTIFRASAGASREWPYLAETEKFLLIVPNGTNPDTGDTYGDSQNWNDLRPPGSDREVTADDVGFLRKLMDLAVATGVGDPLRIYVTGGSNGGGLTQRAVMNLAGKIAAASPQLSNLHLDNAKIIEPGRPVPLLFQFGMEDPLMTYGGIPGQTRSADDTLAWWTTRNGAGPALPEIAYPDLDPNDQCRIYRRTHPAGPGGAPVEMLRIEGGGHSAPSIAHASSTLPAYIRIVGRQCRDSETAHNVWEFFQQFSIPLRPALSDLTLLPALPGQARNVSLSFTGGYPSGHASLQASGDLGVTMPWIEIATATLDDFGNASWSEVGDPRMTLSASQLFLRAATTPVAP